jgi:choline kinase
MKAVISAAGRGTRLGKLTEETPKCLLRVSGKAIIDYSLDSLRALGIKDENIAIIVGFQKEKIINHLHGGYLFIVNDDFAETNDMASFFLSREFVGQDDCLFLHSDVFFHPDILKNCAAAPAGKNYLVVDTEHWNEESMKVSEKDGCVVKAGKELKDEETRGDWIGLAKFDKNLISDVYGTIEARLVSGDKKSWIATGCFNDMALAGHKLHIFPVGGKPWIEIDFAHELEKANAEIYGKIFGK